MVKIVLFNGPPRSGKDTATQLAMEILGKRAVFYRFAGPLKDAVHGLFGFGAVNQEHFDKMKEIPNPLFFGMTPREAYIWMSEEVVKPKFGKDFFAKVAVNNINNMNYDDRVIVISDCGFIEEVLAMVEAFGNENVVLIYLKREGTEFKTDKIKDSRSYIVDVDCAKYTINNNHSLGELHENIKNTLRAFLDAK